MNCQDNSPSVWTYIFKALIYCIYSATDHLRFKVDLWVTSDLLGSKNWARNSCLCVLLTYACN